MKYLSLFSGIGGFELGIQQANDQCLHKVGEDGYCHKCFEKKLNPPQCIGYSEIDKYAIQIYEKNFNHKNYGEITKLDASALPDFELLVGGFPCQSFSIAGKRGGFNDVRGTLFFDIARIIKQKQPRLLLLENVKGLLSHDQGTTFATIIATLDELGYDIQWQIINSKNHGVPQNRERVFIIGHLRGTPRPEVFPFTGDTTGKGYKSQQDRVYPPHSIMGTLPAHRTENKCRIFSTALDANYAKGDNRPNNKSGRTRIIKNSKIRRLTPKECERLQGFPDDWTKLGYEWSYLDGVRNDFREIQISDTQRYKCLGNAVTVNVIKAIMEKLL